MSFLHSRSECRCSRLPWILIRKCCFVMLLRYISVIGTGGAGAPGAGTWCSWGSVSSFRLHVYTGHQMVEMEWSSGTPSLFPWCSRIKLGVPGMEPQKHCVYFPTHQALRVALGRLQSLWHSGLIQSGKFCLYLLLAALFQWSVSTGKTSLQEREETWRVLDL